MTFRRSLLPMAFVALAAGSHAHAQGYPFSQRGSVSQTVAFTNITVEYGRPVARGRLLFGDSALAKWNVIWHPGADSATRISFDHDVLIEGRPLAAGDYSLWLVPRNGKAWSVVFNSKARTFHTPYPGEATDVLRVDVMPEHVSHMESMAIYFPAVQRDSAVMRIHWGETAVPVRIKAPYRPAS